MVIFSTVGGIPYTSHKKAKTVYDSTIKHCKHLFNGQEIKVNVSYGALLRDLEKKNKSNVIISRTDRSDLSLEVVFFKFIED